MRTGRTLLIATVIAALVATGCEWHFEVLDGNGGPNGRIVGDVAEDNAAIIYNNRPHVFYHDAGNHDLRHAYWNGQFWAFETLDGHQTGPNGQINGNAGQFNAAIIYNGRPHVFYWEEDAEVLRHAYYNGQFWAFETLDGHQSGPNGQTTANVGPFNSVVIYNGRPHVFFFNLTEGHLRHGYYTGTTWVFETLDGAGGPNGRTTTSVGADTTALLYNGRPHVFYRTDQGDEDLRHGYWNGQFWAFETLDGLGGPNGRIDANVGEGAAALLYNDRPHVFYRDSGIGNLRHAYYTGSAWGFETLDGHQDGPHGQIQSNLGSHNAAVLYNGRPHDFYSWAAADDLRHGYWNGQLWAFETLDGAGGPNGRINAEVGTDNAAVIYNGRPDVFYRDDTNGNLRHAYFG